MRLRPKENLNYIDSNCHSLGSDCAIPQGCTSLQVRHPINRDCRVIPGCPAVRKLCCSSNAGMLESRVYAHSVLCIVYILQM